MEQGAGGLEAAAVGGWRTIMQGLDELAISAVGVDSVLSAVELVGREYTASGEPFADLHASFQQRYTGGCCLLTWGLVLVSRCFYWPFTFIKGEREDLH